VDMLIALIIHYYPTPVYVDFYPI